MIDQEEIRRAKDATRQLLMKSGVPVSEEEMERIEVIDFGLGNLEEEGLQLITMFETDRIAGRILVMTPNQTEPEHWHPPFGSDPGKQEIIRSFWGEVRFYLPGENSMKEGFLVKGKEANYSMRNEVILSPGDTLVLEPGSKHWFQAGRKGAVFYSFSTLVKDGADGFTDKNVLR
jgi:D-lyxose ketol-isomerase